MRAFLISWLGGHAADPPPSLLPGLSWKTTQCLLNAGRFERSVFERCVEKCKGKNTQENERQCKKTQENARERKESIEIVDAVFNSNLDYY